MVQTQSFLAASLQARSFVLEGLQAQNKKIPTVKNFISVLLITKLDGILKLQISFHYVALQHNNLLCRN
jgi:hypothetical protein